MLILSQYCSIMFAFNQCFHLMRLILQLQSTNIEPELEAKFRRNEKYEQRGFVLVMCVLFIFMLVRMVDTTDFFDSSPEAQ